ncbi:hypothetical protein MTO96_003071 [Rhipicephalus appendiculatus]
MKWHCVAQAYIKAAVSDATPEGKQVLLLNALGVEGLDVYCKAADEETQLDDVQATGDGVARDAYQQALAVLDTCFARYEDAVCVRAKFRRRVQQPDESGCAVHTRATTLGRHLQFRHSSHYDATRPNTQGLRDPHLIRDFHQNGGTCLQYRKPRSRPSKMNAYSVPCIS